jgi:NitT/TauT family transport system substrate-binding protein
MGKLKLFCGAMTLLALGISLPTAQAQDTLKIAAGQRGNWDTTIAEIGQLGGIFKKHGLVLEILYTQVRRNAAGK